MSQSFFAANLGKWVMRKLPRAKSRTFFIPNDHKWVAYLHGLQASGVEFSPLPTVIGSTCTACEG
jgi:hypothetical protein